MRPSLKPKRFHHIVRSINSTACAPVTRINLKRHISHTSNEHNTKYQNSYALHNIQSNSFQFQSHYINSKCDNNANNSYNTNNSKNNIKLRRSPFQHFSYLNTTQTRRFTNETGKTEEVIVNDMLSQLQDLEKRQRYRNVYDAIHLDPRVKMSYAEYIELCKLNGLNEKESKELSNSLHNVGLIWYFDGYFEAQAPLILKTKAVTQKFLQTLDLYGELRTDFIQQKQNELDKILAEIAPLEAQYIKIHERAQKFSRRCFQGMVAYVTLHCMLVPYLTFWALSWDIMEPVTYMFNLWTLFIGLWFWRKTGGDWNYDAIKEAILRLRHEKYYKQLNFDIERYESLKERIAEIEDDLLNPEWQMLKSVHPHLPDPVKNIHLTPQQLLEKYSKAKKAQEELLK